MSCQLISGGAWNTAAARLCTPKFGTLFVRRLTSSRSETGTGVMPRCFGPLKSCRFGSGKLKTTQCWVVIMMGLLLLLLLFLVVLVVCLQALAWNSRQAAICLIYCRDPSFGCTPTHHRYSALAGQAPGLCHSKQYV